MDECNNNIQSRFKRDLGFLTLHGLAPSCLPCFARVAMLIQWMDITSENLLQYKQTYFPLFDDGIVDNWATSGEASWNNMWWADNASSSFPETTVTLVFDLKITTLIHLQLQGQRDWEIAVMTRAREAFRRAANAAVIADRWRMTLEDRLKFLSSLHDFCENSTE